jgi:hypothetical protein
MKNEGIVYSLLELEVTLRCWWGQVRKWIHEYSEEVRFIEKELHLYLMILENLKTSGITYVQDKLLGFIPWDRQYDCITLFAKKAGDCNSINRFVQMVLHVYGLKTYLVTYVAKYQRTVPWWKWFIPLYIFYYFIEASHTTVVIKDYGYFYTYDYGKKDHKSLTITRCVKKLADQYKSVPFCFVVQDIRWNIVDDF